MIDGVGSLTVGGRTCKYFSKLANLSGWPTIRWLDEAYTF